jgi:hypothetical protein
MDQAANPRPAAPGGRTADLRLPVRYVHDPVTDRWSFHIEIPPIHGGGCGCREVAERSAIAALRRHLARRPGPRTDADDVGHVVLTVEPAPDEAPRTPAQAQPATIVHPCVGFHPFATSPPVCRGSAEDAAPAEVPSPTRAAVTPARRFAMGFHPHSLRPTVTAEDSRAGAGAHELVGRRVHGRTRDPDATARVAIIDGATGDQVDGCSGPLRDGTCPRAVAGLAVPCAGQRIRGDLWVASRHFCFDVAPGSTRCPLAWLVETLTAATQ